jgi:endonuclease YncB( thermonuclease family)
MHGPKILALAVTLIAAGAVQAEAQCRSGLVSVMDGSRFQMQGPNLWVRLYGIETCDLEQRAFFNGVGWPCGIVAAGWLTQITLGYEIKCIDEGSAEYATFYGRCFLPSGEDIAKLALEKGMAIAKRENGEPIEQSYGLIEAEAREKKAGLWSSNFQSGGVFYRASN